MCSLALQFKAAPNFVFSFFDFSIFEKVASSSLLTISFSLLTISFLLGVRFSRGGVGMFFEGGVGTIFEGGVGSIFAGG
jgi:hypothetical protein